LNTQDDLSIPQTPEPFLNPPVVSAEKLRERCIFCAPWLYDQGNQILLRSDHFYLFAGLGPIVEGYIIIAPYSCDDPGIPLRSISNAPPELVDELLFLRGLVSHFYREQYRRPGMHFEHGRAGVCLPAQNDTKHCYHAHLCCYPVSYPLWEDMIGLRCEEVEGMHDLGRKAGDSPYLFVQVCEVDESMPEDRAQREKWQARIALLKEETDIPSQYLRRLLAARARVGEEFRWDWLGMPELPLVRRLIQVFRDWAPKQDKYVVTSDADQVLRLDFHASSRRSNAVGNDYVAQKFYRTWSGSEQFGAVGRFLKWLPQREKRSDSRPQRPRVLDAGCGPGTYLNAFYHLGIECVGIDLSEQMLGIARQLSASAHQMYDSRRPVAPPELLLMDAFDPLFDDQSFDGIWYSAVAVHLPRGQAPHTLAKLYRILKDDGVLYLSAQVGGGVAMRYEGRVFFYYTEGELRTLFRQAGFKVVEEWDDSTDSGSCGDTREKQWKHYLLQKLPAPIEAKLLSDLGERGVLDYVKSLLPREISEYLTLGVGDDGAVLKLPPDELLVVTTDPCPQPAISLLVEKDERDLWYDGWFSAIINLSDLGAMGAKPLGLLLSVEAEESMSVREFGRFYGGFLEAAQAYDCPVIGGNLKDSTRFTCVGTALGAVRPQNILRRDAARAGERVVALGDMGLFWAGAICLLRKKDKSQKEKWERVIASRSEEEAQLLSNLKQPRPRVREGRALAERNLSRCAMDSSDGLIACFYEIARASRAVDLHIDLAGVTPHPLVQRVAEADAIDARKLMLAWGDWELVCTVADDDLDRLKAVMAEMGCPISVVGSVRPGDGKVWFHDQSGAGPLSYVASERFTGLSYFSHGLENYLNFMRQSPLFCAVDEE